MADPLTESARDFFEGLNGRDDMHGLLSGLDQTIRFIVEDGETFHLSASGGTLRVAEGADGPEVKDHPDVTHFRTNRETLRRLWAGEIRYSDAVIPSGPDMGYLRLVENWMFKKGVINWLGQVIRMGQEGPSWPGSRPTEGWKG